MRKQAMKLIVWLFITLLSISSANLSVFAELGEQENIIRIYTPSDLMKIGNDPDWPLKGHYILMNDLAFEKEQNQQTNFTQIAASKDDPFTGVFDGNGKTIEGLVAKNENGPVSLFGYINGENAVIKDLGLLDIDFSGARVGAIVINLVNGLIENCYSTGKIISLNEVGGIARTVGGTIKNCYSSCEIRGVDILGGIAGFNAENGIISKCYFTGSINAVQYIGGIPQYIGGIVGYNYGLIEKSYFSGTVFCSNSQYYDSMHSEGTGGIAGKNGGVIENCYSLGEITGVCRVGGIVGENIGLIRNCYSASKLYTSFNFTYMGGIVGVNSGDADKNVSIVPEITITRYSTSTYGGGRVMGGKYTLFAKLIYSEVINYAWDKMSVIVRPPWQIELDSIENGKSKSLNVLKSQDTYMELGWIFTGNDPVWEFSGDYILPKLVGVGGQDDLVTPSHLK